MYKPMQKMMSKLGNNKMMAALNRRGGAAGANLNPRQMAQMMDPAMLRRLRRSIRPSSYDEAITAIWYGGINEIKLVGIVAAKRGMLSQ